MSLRVLLLLVAGCHASETLELPPAEPDERSALLAIEDPDGEIAVWAFDLEDPPPLFSAPTGSTLTLLFHRRSLAELFLDEGLVELKGERPLPFDRGHTHEVGSNTWRPIDALNGRLAALRVAAPDREACAAAGGFYPSTEAAELFDCFVWSGCDDGDDAPCPARPRPPAPPSPPRSFALPTCPSGEWPVDVPENAAFVKPGAVGGDGSRERPFATIGEALSAGATILALAKGAHGPVSIDVPATLIGACVETELDAIEIRADASITNLSASSITATDTSSLTIDRTLIGSIELENTFASLTRVRIEASAVGIIARGGALSAEQLEVIAPIGGIELSGAAADLSDVRIGESETALSISGSVRDFGVASCSDLSTVELPVTVWRADLRGTVRIWNGASARISDVAIRSDRDGRAFRLEKASFADVHRIRIDGRNRYGIDVSGTLLLEDAEVRGAVLGILHAVRAEGCMHRVRVVDSQSLGACIDSESNAHLVDLEIARPSGTPTLTNTGNLCIDGTVEAGAGLRIHQLATIELSRFRIADSTLDAALVVYRLDGTRLNIRDGIIENNALLGAQIPEAPESGTPFPLERLMIRVRYRNNARIFGY